MNPAFVFFLLAMLGVCGLAILRGGSDERFGAVALAGAAILSPLVLTNDWNRPEVGIVVVDLALFLALLYLALRSRAFWPLWAAGFQLCAVAAHVVALVMPHLLSAAYAEMLAIWAYPVLAALAVGTLFETRVSHGDSRR